jgi:thioredoxin reductase/NAD-dependent dihydropyrimidine dehydrogenase PreA subunit
LGFQFDPTWLFYLAMLVPLMLFFGLRRQRKEQVSIAKLEEARVTGLDEPVSLHPIIDPLKCIGCASCTKACPEGDILGIINGKAELVAPSACIGHGACRAACPVGAITLVFGTEKRGMELPHVKSDFQTNVPGIYIAGELGGMGLIRNAIEQGRQAANEIGRRLKQQPNRQADYDLIIIGGGPAGISASLTAKSLGLKFATIEQQTLGGTVSHYPRGKLVMTAPAELTGFGKMKFREVGKEALLEFWTDVIQKAGLKIDYDERVDRIDRTQAGFQLQSTRRTVTAATVLLAIGRRGTPRELGVPGEELPKVVYRMIDPDQYQGTKVLVVGGGDSALEAAATLAEETDAKVTLAYRGGAFARAKLKNVARVKAAGESGRLRVMLNTDVNEVQPDAVLLTAEGRQGRLANDHVIVCAGGVLPTSFLRSMGIEIETRYGS